VLPKLDLWGLGRSLGSGAGLAAVSVHGLYSKVAGGVAATNRLDYGLSRALLSPSVRPWLLRQMANGLLSPNIVVWLAALGAQAGPGASRTANGRKSQ